VKTGKDSTAAFEARTGKRVWRNNAGKYSSPIIADRHRTYLVGRSYVYALEKRKGRRKRPARRPS
jgi:outer membrane protein assembly factor BamB